jgi:broad specificity phosphatase PhoE
MNNPEKGIMIRHLEEVDEKEMNINGDIDMGELKLLKDFYAPEILSEIIKGGYENVTLITSDMERSKQTANLLIDEIKSKINIDIQAEIDPRTATENHGKYKKGTLRSNPLIKKAKNLYLEETFEKGNIWYKYGDAHSEGELKYPELNEIFEEPGENQIEIQIRINEFILDTIERIKENPKTLLVLSTHHLTMGIILYLQYVAERYGVLAPLTYRPGGEIHKNEFIGIQEMVGGWENYYNFFKNRNYVFEMDMNKLELLRPVIQSELDIYLARYVQHYGKDR